jgi:hypothetical protein
MVGWIETGCPVSELACWVLRLESLIETGFPVSELGARLVAVHLHFASK